MPFKVYSSILDFRRWEILPMLGNQLLRTVPLINNLCQLLHYNPLVIFEYLNLFWSLNSWLRHSYANGSATPGTWQALGEDLPKRGIEATSSLLVKKRLPHIVFIFIVYHWRYVTRIGKNAENPSPRTLLTNGIETKCSPKLTFDTTQMLTRVNYWKCENNDFASNTHLPWYGPSSKLFMESVCKDKELMIFIQVPSILWR